MPEAISEKHNLRTFVEFTLWTAIKHSSTTLWILVLRFLRLVRKRKLGRIQRLQLVPHVAAFPLKIKSAELGEHWISCGPHWNGGPSPTLTGWIPKIGYSILENASVAANPRISGVILSGKFLFRRTVQSTSPPPIVTSNPPVSGVIHQSGEDLLLLGGKEHELQTGIFVGSPSPHNWYHWLVDTLPTVYLAKFLPSEFDHYPLLLPEEGMVKNDWLRMLYACCGGRRIISLSKERYTRVKSLVWLDGPTARRPMELSDERGLFCMETESLNKFRLEILAKLGVEKIRNRPRNRLFLARSPGSLRDYNQSQLIEIARGYGFEPVFQEAMAVLDVISLVLEAEYLVGPHGAGWATALFAENAKGALIWTWDEASKENWFYNLLAAREIPFQTLFTGPGSNATDYNLSATAFEQSLQEMLR